MGTILESTKELAKRFGVENEEQTIKDQIDAITESIDQNFNGSVDIASAVSEFAKNDNPDARLGTKTITENDTYIALDDELDGYSSVTVNVSGGGETFEVEIDFDSNTEKFVANKTINEVDAAYTQGIVSIHYTEAVVALIRSLAEGIVIPDHPVFYAKAQVDADTSALIAPFGVITSPGLETGMIRWEYSSDYTYSEIKM